MHLWWEWQLLVQCMVLHQDNVSAHCKLPQDNEYTDIQQRKGITHSWLLYINHNDIMPYRITYLYIYIIYYILYINLCISNIIHHLFLHIPTQHVYCILASICIAERRQRGTWRPILQSKRVSVTTGTWKALDLYGCKYTCTYIYIYIRICVCGLLWDLHGFYGFLCIFLIVSGGWWWMSMVDVHGCPVWSHLSIRSWAFTVVYTAFCCAKDSPKFRDKTAGVPMPKARPVCWRCLWTATWKIYFKKHIIYINI